MCKKRLTISDVAELAGVSKTTISHYLNNKFEFMSEKTKQHIADIIEEHDYQPSKIAQSLKSHNTFLIGIVVSDIESPLSGALIKSVEESLEETNYLLMTANSDDDSDKEKKAIEAMLAQQVDGLIVNTNSMDNPYLRSLKNGDTPIILADRFINDHNYDISFTDNKEPINVMYDHLIDEGYEDIYLFTEDNSTISPRFFRTKYFKEKNKSRWTGEDDRVRVIDTDNVEEAKGFIVEIMEEYVRTKKKPAIIGVNGVTLFFVAKCLRELGISLPGELGLCGYDDWGKFTELGWAEMLLGGITTVNSSIHEMGEEVTKMMLSRIEDPKLESREIIISAPMTVRNSTELKSYSKRKK